MGDPTFGRRFHENRTLDHVLDALTDSHRRRILTLLNDENSEAEREFALDELFEGEEIPDQAAVELYHAHLPKLAEAGYIEWDRQEDLIRHGPRYGEIGPLVALLQNHTDALPGEWP